MKTHIIDDKNAPKMWWAGDPRVEKFMKPISAALDRVGLLGQQRTDVYNRAYEAIYAAIKEYGDKEPV